MNMVEWAAEDGTVETHVVREAGVTVDVTPAVLEDVPVLEAVKRRTEERLAAMFRMVTTEPAWREPEPMWFVPGEDGEEGHLVPRHMAGELAEGPPSLYVLVAYQRGVPA